MNQVAKTVTIIERPGPRIRYAPGAFDGHLGREVPIDLPGARCYGRLVSADVVEDGAAVQLTFEVDDATAGLLNTLSIAMQRDGLDYEARWGWHDGLTFHPIPAKPGPA